MTSCFKICGEIETDFSAREREKPSSHPRGTVSTGCTSRLPFTYVLALTFTRA